MFVAPVFFSATIVRRVAGPGKTETPTKTKGGRHFSQLN